MTLGRRAPRHHRRLTVRIDVSYLDEASGRTASAIATTLGAGGLFVATDQPLAPGTRLRVRFRLPGGEAFHDVAAEVVWANDARTPGVSPPALGMGLSFVDRPAVSRIARDLEDLAAPPDVGQV